MKKLLMLPILILLFIFGEFFESYEIAMILLMMAAVAFEPQLIRFEDWIFPKIAYYARRYISKVVRKSNSLMRWLNDSNDSVNCPAVHVRDTWQNSVERGDFSV